MDKVDYKQQKKDFKAEQKAAKKSYKSDQKDVKKTYKVDRPPFKERAGKFGKKVASPFVGAKNTVGKFIHTRQQYNELKGDFNYVLDTINGIKDETPVNTPLSNKLEVMFNHLNRHT